MKLWLKWTLLVWLNAAFSFKLALEQYPHSFDRAGIILGVFSLVVLYIKIDTYLLDVKKLQLRKALLISVFLKALLQLLPIVDLWTGLAATAFIQWVIGEISFVSAYLITLTDGLLLSLIVILITGLVNFMLSKYLNLRN